MNVIYIHTHDMGRWVQPYGHPVRTPAIQKFAEVAVTFRQAFSAAPTCSPSRAALLTGQSAHEAGMLGLAHRGFKLSDPHQHLAGFLRRNGFETHLYGGQHETASDVELNDFYDFHFDVAETGNASLSREEIDFGNAKAAAAFLRGRRRKVSKPLFLSVGIFAPHRPFMRADPARFNPDRLMPPAPLPDTEPTRRDFADYCATLETADRCVGEVLNAIAEASYLDDSLVILTTDHGAAFPGVKCTLSDHGLGVALLISWPGNRLAGRATDALVSQVDLFPTICELTGLQEPPWLRGFSLIPHLSGKRQAVRSEVFAEISFHAAYEACRCIRTNRYKLIRRFHDEPIRPLSNVDAGPSKELFTSAGLQKFPQDEMELYDLVLDAAEGRNLAGMDRYSEVRCDLESRLEDWMKNTNDPLCHGPVPLPPGAVVSASTAYSAEELAH